MHWDFRKDASDNAYTGYYYNKPGDHSVDSAEFALSYMFMKRERE